jgi:hypothetical protein
MLRVDATRAWSEEEATVTIGRGECAPGAGGC